MASATVCAFGCPICANEFKVKEQKHICTIPCGHVYHEQCLKNWFRVRNQEFRQLNCPKCRTKTRESQIVRLFFETYPLSQDTFDETADDANDETADDDPIDESSVPENNGSFSDLVDHRIGDPHEEFEMAMIELRVLVHEHTNAILRRYMGSLNNLDDNLVQMSDELASMQNHFTRMLNSVEDL